MARLPPVVVHEASLRVRGGDGRRSCMLMGTSQTARWLVLRQEGVLSRTWGRQRGPISGSGQWFAAACSTGSQFGPLYWLADLLGGCQRTDQRRGNPKRVVVGARGCAGSVLICSRLRMGVMERRVLVDGWRAWRWTCEQELQVLWLVSTCRWQIDVRFVFERAEQVSAVQEGERWRR